MDLDPQQSKSAAQVSSGSLLIPATASMQATEGPSTSTVPAAVADPALAALTHPCCQQSLGWYPRTFLILQCPLPCAYGQSILTYLLTLPGKQSCMCMPTLQQSSASIPQQTAFACQSRCTSSWSQQLEQSLVMHRSIYCIAQTHSQTAQEQIPPQTALWQTAPPCAPHQQQQLWQPPDGQAGSTNQPQSARKYPCSC